MPIMAAPIHQNQWAFVRGFEWVCQNDIGLQKIANCMEFFDEWCEMAGEKLLEE
jgi:hypothetical protein